jgi:hypothetical protein
MAEPYEHFRQIDTLRFTYRGRHVLGPLTLSAVFDRSDPKPKRGKGNNI